MEHNVLIGDFVTESDKDLFFGPLTDKDTFYRFPNSIRWPQLTRDLGIWSSASEAKRNGWDKDIPEGFSDEFIGKKKHRVTILKITKNDSAAK